MSVCVCVYVCVCVCVCICMHVCVFICVFLRVCICKRSVGLFSPSPSFFFHSRLVASFSLRIFFPHMHLTRPQSYVSTLNILTREEGIIAGGFHSHSLSLFSDKTLRLSLTMSLSLSRLSLVMMAVLFSWKSPSPLERRFASSLPHFKTQKSNVTLI